MIHSPDPYARWIDSLPADGAEEIGKGKDQARAREEAGQNVGLQGSGEGQGSGQRAEAMRIADSCFSVERVLVAKFGRVGTYILVVCRVVGCRYILIMSEVL